MRTIGIDLALTAVHKAVVMEANGEYVTPILSFHTCWQEIEQLVQRARQDAAPDLPLQAVMEPTGMAWFPVAVALDRLGVKLYLVNGQRVHDLRRYYKRHSSSDRISARVLAKIPLIDKESLHPLELPSAAQWACQRGCKELDRLQGQITAIKNRLRDTDRFAWPGLERVLHDIYGPVARLFRRTWYDPAQVQRAGVAAVRSSLRTAVSAEQTLEWVDDLVSLAAEVLQLYGTTALDYGLLQQHVCRELEHLEHLEQRAESVWRDTVRPLYRQLHPQRHLESLYGVGEQGAAVYVSFIGRPQRFPTTRHFRGWHGLIPDSRQSANAESKGLRISQAGPDVVKKFAYINAEVARQYDPQIAAVYHDQMVNKGNHHTQAVCACATHLLDRVLVLLKQDRPYELRDANGSPVSPEQARAIIAQQYAVPDEVRQRNTRRARKERRERRLERRYNTKGSRPS